MSNPVVYSIDKDFQNKKVAPEILAEEISDSAISIAVKHIDTDADQVFVYFIDEPRDSDVTILNGIVTAHTGQRTESKLYAISSLIDQTIAAPSSVVFGDLGGFVTDPTYFTNNLSLGEGGGLIAHVNGQVRTTGSGAEIQFTEDGTVLGSFDAPNTSAAWQNFSFSTDVAMTAGLHSYVLEGRSNGALVALSVRYVQVRFVETMILQ